MSYELVLPDALELAHLYGDHPSSYTSVTNSDDHTVQELYQLHLDAMAEFNRRFWESLSVLAKDDREVLANKMKTEDAYSELLQEAEMEDLEASLPATPEEVDYEEAEPLPALSEVLADLYVSQTVESA